MKSVARAAACLAALVLAGCSSTTAPKVQLPDLPRWNAAGAESLNVSILGYYGVRSAYGVWECAAYVGPGGHEYALLCADSLHVVDLADPRAPRRAAAIAPAGPTYYVDVAVYGHHAYVAARPGPIRIVDLSDPTNPIVLGSIPASDFCACSCGRPCADPNQAEIETLFIDERGVLYVTGIRCGEGMQMYDVATDPAHPRWLCHEHTFSAPGRSYYVHDVYARDGILYVSRSQGRTGGDPLSRWDILDGDPLCPDAPGPCGAERPAWITSFRHDDPDLHSHSAFRLDDPAWLLTCDESEGGHVRSWDLSTITTPLLRGEYTAGGTCHSVHNVYVRGNVAFASWYNHGVVVFDLTNPASMGTLGYYRHPARWHDRSGDPCCDPTDGPAAQCFGVPHLDPYFPSGIFVASEVDGGLLVGRFTP